jgi:spectinomycin phosphotransferase
VYERPANIADADVLAVLTGEWQLDAAELQYLPVGFGGYHWLAVGRSGARWFVTVTELGGDGSLAEFEASMETAAGLASVAGLSFVIAPLPARSGRAVARLSPHRAVTVFPYAAGTPSSFGDVLTSAERTALTTMLARLHQASAVIDARAVPHRDVELAERAVLETSMRERGRPWTGGPYAEPARALLIEYADDLVRTLARFDALARRVAGAGGGLVITHGEPHPGNIIRSGSELALVDWDTVGLAPPERDLWWVLAAGDNEAARYAALTGREVSPDALALYRLRWTLDDVSLFLAELREVTEATSDSEVSWAGFRDGLASLGRA